ncbi:glycosyltransferase family 4 protein [Dyadobacter arcticus]|uniref:Glycosyltransferase involved in cell wall biosynthesis n=1 Tax=Dyadobacter arcticus TaxID=1078754 RepID=A0ABX0ULF6_9BACT|nr:glycosyltransferase family 4 protein [Dyadobacter arcticus]NIJ53722.1 glycosyltransferase involved in cell wall biosynthesis [Dyadobacter arcticus]
MRVLVVHNQLWAHYKSRLFSEMNRVLKETEPDSEFLVAQIALYEASRSAMQNDETVRYDYPYQVLFERSLDSVSLKDRLTALFKIFKSYNPTVLNITGYFDMAQIALLFYAKAKGVKVVISSESSPGDHERSGFREFVKKCMISPANGFFCFGKSSANYIEKLGINPSRILVRNAAVVDEETIRSRFEMAKEVIEAPENIARQFIYVGRLAPEKNLELMIRAFKGMLKNSVTDPGWNLLLVGNGPARLELEKLGADLGLKGRVIFAGGFPWYQIPEWLAKSDVLILPSKSEPWGLVVNEAMICGMPVIVSQKCGCVDDLVKNERNGFIFDPKNQKELENAMQHFVENPEKIAAMGSESLKLIAPFSSAKVASKMIESYKML